MKKRKIARRNIRLRAWKGYLGKWYDVVVCDGNELLFGGFVKSWKTKKVAMHNAKAVAKLLGIKYSEEIYKANY